MSKKGLPKTKKNANEIYEAYLTMNGRIFKKVLLTKNSELFDELINM